jgi:hypothetical protein
MDLIKHLKAARGVTLIRLRALSAASPLTINLRTLRISLLSFQTLRAITLFLVLNIQNMSKEPQGISGQP